MVGDDSGAGCDRGDELLALAGCLVANGKLPKQG